MIRQLRWRDASASEGIACPVTFYISIDIITGSILVIDSDNAISMVLVVVSIWRSCEPRVANSIGKSQPVPKIRDVPATAIEQCVITIISGKE